MANEVRMWEVGNDDSLAEIRASKLTLEERIEDWIKRDISVLQPDLLVIGEQVKTDYGKFIDLLCMDSEGGLVIVELKRGMTPREVTAQALDYASWVKELGAQKVNEIASAFLKDGKTLETAFLAKFDADLPEVINDHHSMKIVASEIDDSTERIIRYLSEAGVDINAVQFHIFQSEGGREFLARTFTVALDAAEVNTKRGSTTKRTKPSKTIADRVKECANQDEIEFFQPAIDQGQRTNSRGDCLAFPSSGTIRWYVVPRRDFATVLQKGRFSGDEEYWQKNLSKAALTLRRNDNDLKFRLFEKRDFDFFNQTLAKGVSGFDWRPKTSMEADDEDTEDLK